MHFSDSFIFKCLSRGEERKNKDVDRSNARSLVSLGRDKYKDRLRPHFFSSPPKSPTDWPGNWKKNWVGRLRRRTRRDCLQTTDIELNWFVYGLFTFYIRVFLFGCFDRLFILLLRSFSSSARKILSGESFLRSSASSSFSPRTKSKKSCRRERKNDVKIEIEEKANQTSRRRLFWTIFAEK